MFALTLLTPPARFKTRAVALSFIVNPSCTLRHVCHVNRANSRRERATHRSSQRCVVLDVQIYISPEQVLTGLTPPTSRLAPSGTKSVATRLYFSAFTTALSNPRTDWVPGNLTPARTGPAGDDMGPTDDGPQQRGQGFQRLRRGCPNLWFPCLSATSSELFPIQLLPAPKEACWNAPYCTISGPCVGADKLAV
jgi:hypothetical protein